MEQTNVHKSGTSLGRDLVYLPLMHNDKRLHVISFTLTRYFQGHQDHTNSSHLKLFSVFFFTVRIFVKVGSCEHRECENMYLALVNWNFLYYFSIYLKNIVGSKVTKLKFQFFFSKWAINGVR